MYLRSARSPSYWLLVPVIVVGLVAAWGVASRVGRDPEQVWHEARAALQAERIGDAEAAVARLSRLRLPTAADWLLRAQVAIAMRRPDEALADLARIPDDDPAACHARLLAGQIELRRNRMRSAEALLLAAAKLDPKLVQAHRELVYIYGMQSRRRELSEQFRVLSELTPLTFDNVFHWCLTRNVVWEPLEIVNAARRFVEADPEDRWSRLSMVDSLVQLGRLDEAEQALAVLPASDPDARAARVRIALARGDDAGAEALLNEGPADHAELERVRGRIALARRDAKAALEHFRAAYKLEPDNRDTLFGLAGAYRMLGDHEAARPYASLATHHDELGTLMQRAAIPGPKKDPALLRELGAACEAIQRLPEARAWYNLVIGIDPLDSEAQQALHRVDAAIRAEKAAKATS